VDEGEIEDGAARTEYSPARLEAFSDGVMAVIITITVLELRAPVGSSFDDLRHELPSLLVYILSFVYIGIYWANHHHLLRGTRRINGAVMWANLGLLFWLSLVPVLTNWDATQYRHSLPAACYGVVMLGAAVAYWILVRTIVRANADTQIVDAIGSDRKGIVSVAVYACAVGLAAASPFLAYALYALVALMWLVPDRRLSLL
jgi:uncharacterized membrane protein